MALKPKENQLNAVENQLQNKIDWYKDQGLMEVGKLSDGSHTFNELYYHRMMLFAVICNTYKDHAWKSKLHDDGTMYDDYFIAGITTPEGDYTYHYHIDHWDIYDVKELEKAPKWDGHMPSHILRIFSLVGDE